MKTLLLSAQSNYISESTQSETDLNSFDAENLNSMLSELFWANILFYLVALLIFIALWLFILRFFNNKSINSKLDKQNELLEKMLSELKKDKPEPKEEKSLDFKTSTSVNDPEVLQKLLDKLGDKDS